MDQYGLIGYPLRHSISKTYFGQKFESEGIRAEYLNFEIPSLDELTRIIGQHPLLKGLNVTIPYKEQIIPFLDALDADARSIGAVNVVKIVRTQDGFRLTGHNSDVTGFVRSIRPLLKPHHRRALVLGTGGASKAVLHGLRMLRIESCLVSRTRQPGRLSYEMLTPEIMETHPVIVNCTPLGMYPCTGACPAIPYETLTPDHLLYDLVYNPEQTLFLEKGAARGATTKNGLEMLVKQADAAWNIWNGVPES